MLFAAGVIASGALELSLGCDVFETGAAVVGVSAAGIGIGVAFGAAGVVFCMDVGLLGSTMICNPFGAAARLIFCAASPSLC